MHTHVETTTSHKVRLQNSGFPPSMVSLALLHVDSLHRRRVACGRANELVGERGTKTRIM